MAPSRRPARSARLLALALPLAGGACHNRCQYKGPASRASQPAWLASLERDRDASLAAVNYSGGVFDRIAWTQTAYIQPQMHPYDRYFYDEIAHNYTVGRYLANLRARYGGIDALLLWPTYTNIGIDDRNQFDYFRLMPGGLDGLARVIKDLKAAGVRVLWPYNPWDTGTRREGAPDAEVLAKLLRQTGGDGLNGDTMAALPQSFWDAGARLGHPLALEAELGGSDESINWSTMGWGYWDYPLVPEVDRFKWLTRGKWLTHACNRWATSKTDELQSAWFNGDGFESWENVWGTWNGMVPRDGEATRRVGAMLRYLGSEHAGAIIRSPLWEPHTPRAVRPQVFASQWAAADGPARRDRAGRVLKAWTLVNRHDANLTGAQLVVEPSSPASRFYDCYHGAELHPAPAEGSVALSFEMEAHGFGCVVETGGPADASLSASLRTMATMTATPLSAYSDTWEALPQTMAPYRTTPPPPDGVPPAGMVLVPSAAAYNFSSVGLEIEGNDAQGVDFQFPWEDTPRREHALEMRMRAFYIDAAPATCTDYAAYLRETGYAPADARNWLRGWGGARKPPPHLADAPVTWISYAEARAYCAWAHGGARLPHAWEWQRAARGDDGRAYPWGNNASAEVGGVPCMPEQHAGTTCPGPEPVRSRPAGCASPFGVTDAVGSVWQYTDAFADEHTRAVMLRGGSSYRPTGSHWYFPNSALLTTHNKYFLFDDAYERAATIGVRCVKDSLPEAADALAAAAAAGAPRAAARRVASLA